MSVITLVWAVSMTKSSFNLAENIYFIFRAYIFGLRMKAGCVGHGVGGEWRGLQGHSHPIIELHLLH